MPQPLARAISAVQRRDRLFFPAVALIAILLLALQSAGGAFRAEFDGHPDESAQFVSGRMLWEYLHALPAGNPVSWAEQYYIHYPKVAIGHWPPGYHLAEAFWSFVLGSSRVSAMLLQWFLGLAALTGLYVLARPRFPVPVTAAIVLFAAATPVFQRGLEQTMAEPACLLCGVVFLHVTLRLLRRVDRVSIAAVALAMGAAATVKLTAVCLLPVPFFALLASGKRSSPRLLWLASLVAAVIGAGLFLSPAGRFIAWWGGMTSAIPWPLPMLGALAGWGFVGLAAFGLRREPLAIASASMVAAAAAVSFAVRAMNEPRHWIIVLPPLLLLAGFAVTRFGPRTGALLALPAILLFPWSWYHQSPSGCRDLIQQLHLPARMLVSSGGTADGEGAWIAEVSIAERYPASLIARASKVLASSGWSGEQYRLTARSPAEVAKILDELDLDTVVLFAPDAAGPPHHALLAATVAHSSAWRLCGAAGEWKAWRRAEAPRFPRVPLTLYAGGLRLVEKQ